MVTTIRAVFDGEVPRPEEPQPLRADTTDVIAVEREAPPDAASEPEEPYALAGIGRLAVDMDVEDVTARHDRSIHDRLPDEPSWRSTRPRFSLTARS